MNWKELEVIDSPLINQYVTFKKQYEHEIVFFQVGEFYEIYAQDANQVATELSLKLTSRTIGGVSIPMCGVPAGGGMENANKLAQMGYHVAFVSQKKDEEGQVTRYLDGIITPATITDDAYLASDEHAYIMTVYTIKNELGITILDTLSGEVLTRTCHKYTIFDVLTRYVPKEVRIYLPKAWEPEMMQKIKAFPQVQCFVLPYFYEEMKPAVEEHRSVHFKDTPAPFLVVASHYFMMQYVGGVQSQSVTIRPVHYIEEKDFMVLHAGAINGLDLLENAQTKKKKGSIYDLLDRCVTPKGSRTLKKWIQEPLINSAAIESRYQLVDYFLSDEPLRLTLRDILLDSADLERMIARFESAKFKENELPVFLKTMTTYQLALREIKTKSTNASLIKLAEGALKKLDPLISQWQSKISEEDIIAIGYDKTFDAVRETKKNGLQKLLEYASKEREISDIRTLKLEENKVLGYFFEVTNSHISKVPSHFIERQKVASGKRYVTEELKEMESNYYEAQEKYDALRKTTMLGIVLELAPHYTLIRKVIDMIGLLDVLMSLSDVAKEQGYKRPTLTQGNDIRIMKGIHPLLQKFAYKKMIPNPCDLAEGEIQIVTGPNMGGKSTYLKMVGSLLVMAQIGSFVPASLQFTPVDRVLLRMGAGDALLNGQSTFAVEMEEVAYIMYHGTDQSLILMDELGRGTSTSDGIAIAKSVIDYIHDTKKSKTICSTHYHELIEMENDENRILNYHAEIVRDEDDMVLTYHIRPGGSEKSFGIEVAKKVGLPNEILEKAQAYLNEV